LAKNKRKYKELFRDYLGIILMSFLLLLMMGVAQILLDKEDSSVKEGDEVDD